MAKKILTIIMVTLCAALFTSGAARASSALPPKPTPTVSLTAKPAPTPATPDPATSTPLATPPGTPSATTTPEVETPSPTPATIAPTPSSTPPLTPSPAAPSPTVPGTGSDGGNSSPNQPNAGDSGLPLGPPPAGGDDVPLGPLPRTGGLHENALMILGGCAALCTAFILRTKRR